VTEAAPLKSIASIVNEDWHACFLSVVLVVVAAGQGLGLLAQVVDPSSSQCSIIPFLCIFPKEFKLICFCLRLKTMTELHQSMMPADVRGFEYLAGLDVTKGKNPTTAIFLFSVSHLFSLQHGFA
jgi:hypothetical protein